MPNPFAYSFGFGRPAPVPADQPGNLGSFYGSTLTSPRYLEEAETMRSAALNGYEATAAIYTLASAWWRMVSSVPWVVEMRHGQEWDAQPGHPVEVLVEYPNPEQTRQWQMAMRALHLALCGSTMSSISFLGTRFRNPAELWILNPDSCSPVMNGDYRIGSWEITEGSQPKTYQTAQITHAKFPNPRNPALGLAPYKAARSLVTMDRAQLAANAKVSADGNRFPGVWTTPQNPDELAIRELGDRLQARFSDPSLVNRPIIATNGAGFSPAAWSARELDSLGSRGLTFTELCRVYWMPEAIFNSDAQTFDNFRTARLAAWEDAAVTVLNVIAEALNLSLVPWADRRDVWLTYDLSGVPALAEHAADIRAKNLEAHERAVRSCIPANESFVLNGLQVPPQPGGDRALVGSGLTLLEDATAQLGGDFNADGSVAGEPVAPAVQTEPTPTPEELAKSLGMGAE